MLEPVIACVIPCEVAPCVELPAAGAPVGAAGPSPKEPVQAAPLGQQPMLPASSSAQLVSFGQQAALFMEEQSFAHLESRRKRSRCMRSW